MPPPQKLSETLYMIADLQGGTISSSTWQAAWKKSRLGFRTSRRSGSQQLRTDATKSAGGSNTQLTFSFFIESKDELHFVGCKRESFRRNKEGDGEAKRKN